MGHLLGLLAAQPEATKRTCWARRWAVALNGVEMVAVAEAGLSLPLERPSPGQEGGGVEGSSSSRSGGDNWVTAVREAVIMLSDLSFAPGEVKPQP